MFLLRYLFKAMRALRRWEQAHPVLEWVVLGSLARFAHYGGMIRMSLLALPLLLAGCGSPAPKADQQSSAASASAVTPAPAPLASPVSVSLPQAGPVALAEKTELLDFKYSWPAAAAKIPALDARLRADARTTQQHMKNQAAKAKSESETGSFPFHSYETSNEWNVEGDTPKLLALRDSFYEYTGGAHGMSGFQFILWDRAIGHDITTLDLFADKTAAMASLKQAFCPALNRERAKRRGAPVPPSDGGTDDWMNGCPDLAKQVLIPGDVKRGRFTTIHVLIGPYEAGPYAEGTYDIVLPITRSLLALAKPSYAEALATGS